VLLCGPVISAEIHELLLNTLRGDDAEA
jgi:hypothetical protein